MYKYILFDADDTLLDFQSDKHNAFFALLKEIGLPADNELYDEYTKLNLSLWERFERGEIDKQYILDHRFSDLIESGKLTGDGKVLNDRFCYHLSNGNNVISDADSICKALKDKGYQLYIVTNGIKFIQDKRFKTSGLLKYFDDVFISESIGYQKPKAEFFDCVFKSVGDSDKSNYLIVGDSLTSDIKGGKNAGIDTCWYNINNVRNSSDTVSDYTIYKLSDLLDIL